MRSIIFVFIVAIAISCNSNTGQNSTDNTSPAAAANVSDESGDVLPFPPVPSASIGWPDDGNIHL